MEREKKIAIIYDRPGWAFHKIAKQLARHTEENIKVDIYASGAPRSWQRFYNALSPEYDLVHFLWRPAVQSLAGETLMPITTAVYDHLYLEEKQFTTKLLSNVPFYVSSSKLATEYEKIFPGQPVTVCSDGVDPNIFYPQTFLGKQKKLTVGWVGNSKWANTNNKGFKEIFLKAVQLCEERGFEIESKVVDSASGLILTELEMSEYYQDIDILVCSSIHEGTPNPILEAAASGRAFVSTDVGIVRDLSGPLQSEFIVDRDPIAFANAFETLSNNREMLRNIGDENRLAIENAWTWKAKANSIHSFFLDQLRINSECKGI